MFKLFQNQPIVYGISQKTDGNMHLAFKNHTQNRKAYFKKQGLADKKVFSADLAHGTNVVKVTGDGKLLILARTDALVTANKNIILTLTVADCFPVYFFDPKNKTIAVAHCGWRGTIANLAAKTVSEIGGNPANILVGIGPGIRACHFEIQNNILDKFSGYNEAITKRGDKIFVDLPKIIHHQLTQEGIPHKNIETLADCTYCLKNDYFSFRRDKPTAMEAMVAYIGLR